MNLLIHVEVVGGPFPVSLNCTAWSEVLRLVRRHRAARHVYIATPSSGRSQRFDVFVTISY